MPGRLGYIHADTHDLLANRRGFFFEAAFCIRADLTEECERRLAALRLRFEWPARTAVLIIGRADGTGECILGPRSSPRLWIESDASEILRRNAFACGQWSYSVLGEGVTRWGGHYFAADQFWPSITGAR
jgi:hypothetical protein